MKLSDLFYIRNGVASNNVEVLAQPVIDSVPYIRPASTQQRTIAGWVKKNAIKPNHIYPRGTIFVSTDGEGSHTYSYVSGFDFVPNSNVSVLLPKREMALQEKIFYAHCITMNRYRFSYGRKPKGERLGKINVPGSAPEWFSELDNISIFDSINRFKEDKKTYIEKSKVLELVRIQDLFDVRYGHSLELNRLRLLSKGEGGIPFVSRKMGDNGISSYVAPIYSMPPASAGELTCALSGNGVLSTFYQETPFYTGFHVACLRPLFEMSREELLYYCSCIWQNRNKFSYGRQANRTLKDLLVPSRDSVPHWVYGALSQITEQVISSSAR
ncbi:hypothetical protein [Pectobacterium peruviense]|uniref:Restriction endonuclease subunit S n=1 Tax=Pectobacterium peruviense TaxID=2066479 RepID=A0ABX4SB95_9GAMM|nr:hypothetical protein [Pectobacterium peruviense]PKX82802.1 hypothetical protein A0G02_13825 [Pectobacterium peruviense]PKX87018.1 hypothetical protein A0G03_08930 [Pectobacterium peruviense]